MAGVGSLGPMSRPVPTVSVVMPVRDGAGVVGRQLDALARQDCAAPWEVVVVDDGSRDGTAELVRGWHDRLPRLRVVSFARSRGSGAARNAGAAAADGDALVFCDADDVVAAGWLAAHAAALGAHELVTGPILVDRLNPVAAAAAAPPVSWDRRPPIGNGFLPYGLTANLGVSRRLFDHVGGFDGARRHGNDKTFCWSAILQGAELHFAREAAVHYRLRPRPRGTFRRQFAIGRAAPSLYRRFAADGMPRSRGREAVRDLARLAVRAPRLATSEDVRLEAARIAGRRLGRLVGSLEHRTRYL